MKVWDLHCHTNASDGELSPADLWQRAIDNGIDHLAITDHDTIGGVLALQQRLSQTADLKSSEPSLELIPGVEITSADDGSVFHIVGLWFDVANGELQEFLAAQQEVREFRGQAISERLVQTGLPSTYEGAKKLANGSPLGRPHFARHLIELGIAKDMGEAFKRWLGNGKAGDIDIEWPSMERVVQVIHDAGGVAVLAHPAKYSAGFGKCYALCERFKAVGGQAMEVVSGAQLDKVTRDLSRIAERLDLAASTGSDFHSPSQTWCDLGGQGKLPESLQTIWQVRESMH